MDKFKCIYAILDCNKNLGLTLKGLDNSSIYTLSYKDISAAVSDIDPHTKISGVGLDKEELKPDKECATLYGNIIERIMAKYTLLPMRFGTLVKEDKDVTAVLERYYDEFVNNLRQVKGKLEYGLKVLWDVEKVGQKIRAQTKKDNLRGFDQLKGDSPHKEYLRKKLKEHKFEEALMKKAEALIEDIHSPLKELSNLSRFKKMLTKNIILDAAYLVEKKEKETFVQKFEELKEKHKGLKFLLTGPWPPYNFVSVKHEKSSE